MQMIMQMNKFLVLLLVLSGAAWVARAQKNNITSILEVLDVQTGGRRVVKEFNYLMEAPNWTRDGQWLYFNSGGLIYKIDAGGKGNARLVDTQSVSRCNNDHILSFGRQVGPLPHVSQRRPRAGRAPGQQELLGPDSRYVAFVSYRVDGH